MECFLAQISSDEQISGHSFFAHDISERKQTEEHMRQANLRLEELHRTKSEFTSMVSHELRTPLAAIKEGIEIILDGLDGPITEGQRSTLDIVNSNIDRFARLVNNVLDFSKLESGNMKMNFQMTNLNELVDKIYGLSRHLADKKSIALEVDLPDKPLSSVCDSDNLQQVLINLINNALKFTETGGGIAIRLKHTMKAIVMEVEDTGIGVCEEDREKIFEMYAQSFRRGIWATGGSGIGLSVCKKIMELHHGTITVKSALKVGSIFTVMFPKNLQATVIDEVAAVS
jgi:signal transduction histidine kinase